jgi:hypothetical protein
MAIFDIIAENFFKGGWVKLPTPRQEPLEIAAGIQKGSANEHNKISTSQPPTQKARYHNVTTKGNKELVGAFGPRLVSACSCASIL